MPWRGRFETELGGALLTHAIHSHDILTYLMGDVASVFARTATRVNPIEVEDCAVATLELQSGALASLATGLLRLPTWQIPLVFVGIILLISLPSMVIAWLTVGHRAIKTAMASPVKNLRTE